MSNERSTLVEKLDALEREAQTVRAQIVALEAPHAQLELGVILVRLGETYATFPIEVVDEIVDMAWLAPMAEAPPWVAGLLDRAGEIIPVIDVLSRIELRAREAAVDDRIVLARADGRRVGFIVQELLGIRQLPSHEVHPAPEHLAFARYVSGLVILEDALVPMLSPALLLYAAGVSGSNNPP